jgi:hypothetical protein
MKTLFTCSALALGVCIGSSAQAEVLRNFHVANWFAGAYSFEGTRTFSHCAANASYTSGILVLFSINRSYAWNMGFANPQWRLTKGQQYDIAFSVDGSPPIFAKAAAVRTEMVLVNLADSTQLFSQFRRGRMLQVGAANQVFSFSLDGTSALLPSLLNCVRQETTPVGETNPFAAQQATRTTTTRTGSSPVPAAAPSSREAFQAEAAILGANILSEAGINAPLGPVETAVKVGADAVWAVPSNQLTGTIKIFDTINLNDPSIPSVLIGRDAKDCKGAFLSGSLPESDGKAILRIFTSCQEEKDSITVYYLAVPRPKGGIYLFTTMANNMQEAVKETDSDLRQAVFKVIH